MTAMFESRALTFAVGLICLLYFARPSLAFGAGNIASISKIEGQNCAYRPRFASFPPVGAPPSRWAPSESRLTAPTPNRAPWRY